MPRSSRSSRALPAIALDQVKKVGTDIAVARKRRRISMREMAKRMMVNLKTLQRLEKGDPTVGLGILVTALWILGMHRRFGDLVAPESDTAGLNEDIRNLPRDFRKSKKGKSEDYDF